MSTQLPSPTPSVVQHTPPPVASTSRGPAGGSDSGPATLPAVGTTFVSLEALELACYAYALACDPIISFGKLNRLVSGGRKVLRFGCTALKHTKGVADCPCSLDAAEESAGWVVTCTSEVHSHDRAVDVDIVRRRMRERIARAGDVDEGQGKGKQKVSSTKGRPSSTSSREAASILVEKHPTADDLWQEIRDRQEEFSGLVPFPTPSEAYATARLLLVDVFAAYAQRGVQLFRPRNTLNSIMLKCHMGHGKRKPPNGETCKMRVQLGRCDGQWRFESELGEHNHPFGEEMDAMSVDGDNDASDSEPDQDGSDGTSENESDSHVDQKLVHAPHDKISPSVRSLTLSRPLQFPLPTNGVSFRDHDAFRIYALAAAIQRRYTLQLQSKTSTSFNLLCSFGNSRHRPDHCTFIMLVECEGASWSCTRIHGQHNHPLLGDDDAEGNRRDAWPDVLEVPNGRKKRWLVEPTAAAPQVPQKRALDSPPPAPALATPSHTTNARLIAPLPDRQVHSAAAPRPAEPRPVPIVGVSRLPPPGLPIKPSSNVVLPAPQGVKRYGAPSRLPPVGAPPPKVHYVPRETDPVPKHYSNAHPESKQASVPSLTPQSRLPTTANRASPTSPATRDPPPVAPLVDFSPTLESFLANLSPSLATQVPLFLHAGLTSSTQLANLLLLSNERLVESGWITELAKDVVQDGSVVLKGLPKLFGTLLLNGLERMRGEMRAALLETRGN